MPRREVVNNPVPEKTALEKTNRWVWKFTIACALASLGALATGNTEVLYAAVRLGTFSVAAAMSLSLYIDHRRRGS